MPSPVELGSPNPLAIAPFVVLLLAIALMPLVARRWWGKFYPLVTLLLALVTATYYLLGRQNGIRLVYSLEEYLSFISLLLALFVIAGGIHLHIQGTSTPWQNTVFLAISAILANLIGTTGASMVLIRPYLRLNRSRWRSYHMVFFIFLVSNCGGALTPIGDPPLLLGYLRGIPFSWTIQYLWPMWVFAVGSLLALFYLVDRGTVQRSQPPVESQPPFKIGKIAGAHNAAFLAIALGALLIDKPHFLRELILLGAAMGSYLSTRREIHRLNEFLFRPIIEVAILFAGIFITMVPALDWLEANAQQLPLRTPGQFFWSSGILSAVLDNAPTYLAFLSTAAGVHSLRIQNPADIQVLLHQQPLLVAAISIGCVFFGALTYIGNGPNFMVKSIVEQSKLRCPHFLEYTFKFALPFLFPILLLVWLVFFR